MTFDEMIYQEKVKGALICFEIASKQVLTNTSLLPDDLPNEFREKILDLSYDLMDILDEILDNIDIPGKKWP